MSKSKHPKHAFQNEDLPTPPALLDAWWSEPQPEPPEVATTETCHCGEPMVERPGSVNGYLILDCPGCGHVRPVAVGGSVDQ